MNITLRWYDRIAGIHDGLNPSDRVYREARRKTIAALDLHQGDVVIDLFCGTGWNFSHILPLIGSEGRLIGIDGSPGMLARAQQRPTHEKMNQTGDCKICHAQPCNLGQKQP